MTLILEDTLTFEEVIIPGYEKVIKISQKEAGLSAIICIHNSALGPALGGTRIYPYPTFEAALNDVMRLAQGMTYKSALAECGWGGGKSVIIADPKRKTKELLRAFGHAVHRLKGEYICAEDVGSTPDDMQVISQATPYVVGLPHEKSSGNPSPFTAWGTFRGIQSVLKKIFGSDSLEERTVALQGLGSVGWELAQLLFWAGARLIITDIDQEKCAKMAKLTGAKVIAPEDIYAVECDVFCPCALGGIINEKVIPHLSCRAIAGAANNQLLKDSDADELLARGILYAPDFIINAGGLLNVTQELFEEGYDPCKARNKVHKGIYSQLMLIYDIAEQNKYSTHRAALSLADYRLKYRIGRRFDPPYFHHAKK
ncbi:MAG TPA: Glu/Leu/Phe/Val dehydrogenase [Rhabdochlamydiaceae bacterium]|jgi:leucine dehydrogenase